MKADDLIPITVEVLNADPAYIELFKPTLLCIFSPTSIVLSTKSLTAFDGGALRKIADYCVHVPTQASEYGPAEDAHMILDHLVGAYLMRYIKNA